MLMGVDNASDADEETVTTAAHRYSANATHYNADNCPVRNGNDIAVPKDNAVATGQAGALELKRMKTVPFES